jgi:hypothetical protein
MVEMPTDEKAVSEENRGLLTSSLLLLTCSHFGMSWSLLATMMRQYSSLSRSLGVQLTFRVAHEDSVEHREPSPVSSIAVEGTQQKRERSMIWFP